MYHICLARNLKIPKLNRIRLYSSCFLNKTVFINIKLQQHEVQKRNFSLQSTVESLMKTHSGIFKSLSESVPVSYAQEFLLYVHSTTGLSWWASIILTTITLRSCLTLPFSIYQNYILAKVENLQLEMPPIIQELKKETAIAIKKFKWDDKTARFMYNRSLRTQWNNLIVRDNCHPFKASVVFWVQLPLWICISVSLRNLVYMLPIPDVAAQITFTELSLGGIAWIPNLIMPDTSFILPVTFGLINLLIIEIQVASKKKAPTKFQRYMTNFFRGFSIFMVPVSASVPSCITLYWVSSSVYGLIQNLMLLSPKIRRLGGIPKTPSEMQQPYSYVAMKLKDRFSLKKKIISGST